MKFRNQSKIIVKKELYGASQTRTRMWTLLRHVCGPPIFKSGLFWRIWKHPNVFFHSSQGVLINLLADVWFLFFFFFSTPYKIYSFFVLLSFEGLFFFFLKKWSIIISWFLISWKTKKKPNNISQIQAQEK
jgi:hypothetical protein